MARESFIFEVRAPGVTQTVQQIERFRRHAEGLARAVTQLKVLSRTAFRFNFVGEAMLRRAIDGLRQLRLEAQRTLQVMRQLQAVGAAGVPPPRRGGAGAFTGFAAARGSIPIVPVLPLAGPQAPPPPPVPPTPPVPQVVPPAAPRRIRQVGAAARQARVPVDALTLSLRFLRGALVVFASIQIGRQFLDIVDSFTRFRNQLKLVTADTSNLNRVQEELIEVARQTRSSLEDTSNIFSKTTRAVEGLGFSQKDVIEATTAVNQAVQISGVTAETASNGLQQFAQGLASGALTGDELRSVTESLPRLAKVIADEFGVLAIELRAFQEANPRILTTERIMRALAKAAPELAAEFAKLKPTLDSAFVVFNNSLTVAIARIDEVIGFSDGFARAILAVADNMRVLTAVVAGLGAAITTVLIPPVLRTFLVVERSLTGLFPLIAGLTAFLGVMRNDIRVGIDDWVTLGDLTEALGIRMKGAFERGEDALADFIRGANTARRTVKILGTDVEIEARKFDKIEDAFDDLSFARRFVVNVKRLFSRELTFEEVALSFAVMVDSLLIQTKALFDALTRLFEAGGARLGEALIQAFDQALPGTETAQRALGIAPPEDQLAVLFAEVRAEYVESIRRQLREAGGVGLTQQEVIRTFDLARVAGAGREGRFRDRGELLPGEEGRRDQREQAELTKAQASNLESLLGRLLPAQAALKELDEAEKLLNESFRLGAPILEEFGLTVEDVPELVDRLKFSLRDTLDPLGAVLREMEEQRDVIGLNERATDIYNQTLAITRDLEAELGQELLPEHRAQVQAWVTDLVDAEIAWDDLNEAMERQQDLLADITVDTQAYMQTLADLEDLLRRGAITQEQYARAVLDTEIALREGATDAISGFERGFLKAQQAATDFATDAEKIITTAFEGATDAVVEFVKTGKLEIGDLAREIAELFIRLGLKQLVAGALGQTGIGGFGAGLFGRTSFLGNLLGGNPLGALSIAGGSPPLVNGIPAGGFAAATGIVNPFSPGISSSFGGLGIGNFVSSAFRLIGSLFGFQHGGLIHAGSGGILGAGGRVHAPGSASEIFGPILARAPGGLGTLLRSWATNATVRTTPLSAISGMPLLGAFAQQLGSIGTRGPLTRLPGVLRGPDDILAQFRVSEGEQIFVLNRRQQRRAGPLLSGLRGVLASTGGSFFGFQGGGAIGAGAPDGSGATMQDRSVHVTNVFNGPQDRNLMRESAASTANRSIGFAQRVQRRNGNG